MAVNGIEIRYGQNWMSSEGTRLRVKELGQDYAVLEESSGCCGYFHMDGVCKKNPSVRLVRLVEDPMTTKGVNGVEIKVGQKWCRRDGSTVVIKRTGKAMRGWKEEFKVLDDTGDVYTCTGHYTLGVPCHERDLVELIEDVKPEQQQNAAQTPSAAFDAEITRMVTMRKSPFTAPALLEAAAGHMRDRAATYDKPEGERSMAQTVALFNQYHSTALTEAQGWHFMQILKDVRLFANPSKPHRDSIEDGVAYCALKGEAMLKGGTTC